MTPRAPLVAVLCVLGLSQLLCHCGSSGSGNASGGSGGHTSGGSAGADASSGGVGGVVTGGSGGVSASGGMAGLSSGGSAGQDASTGGVGGSAGADSGPPPVCTVQVSAGGEHTCAIKIDGSVWCWGADEYGQLGDGTITGTETCYGQEGCNPTPAMVTGLSSGFAQVAAGFTHTCARKASGDLYCWGENTDGELGDGTTGGQACFTSIGKCKPTPGAVASLAGSVAFVSVGYGPQSFDCVKKTDSTVWCWGGGIFGIGGFGPTPQQVPGLGNKVAQVSSGGGHACALETDGTVWCWGRNNVGQLGDGSTSTSVVTTPVKASLDYQKPFIAVSAGFDHSCAVHSNGELWCWGGNAYGQVGVGTKTTAIPIPQLIVAMGSTTASVEAGDGNSCGQKTDSTYWCWGSGGNGELGTGGPSSPTAPAPVSTLGTDYFGLDLGHQHTCAIKTVDGTTWCWGEQSKGQIGNGNAYAPSTCSQLPQTCTYAPTQTLLPCP